MYQRQAGGNPSDCDDMEMPPSSQQTNVNKESSSEGPFGPCDGEKELGSILPPPHLHHGGPVEEERLAKMISSDVVLARLAGPDGHRARLRLQQVSRLQRSSSGAGGARDASAAAAAVMNAGDEGCWLAE